MKSKSEVMQQSHAISNTVYLSCTLNQFELATATKVDTDVMCPLSGWKFPLLLLTLFINKLDTDVSARAWELHFTEDQ